MLFDETGLKSPIFYSEDFAIDCAAMPKKLCAMQWKASSQRMSRHRTGWGGSLVEDQVRAAGQVSDRRLREGPCRRRGVASRRKDFVYVGKVGTGFNRKSSVEIRKKLDATLSSKSRLAKAPRLKGATWVLRADR
jgi:hypothetical protein